MKKLSIFNFQFSITLWGWIVAVIATTVYLLTLEPTVSFWDCGEFIATSYGLEVGHPPGAPLYTLLAHCFTLLAGSPERVAWWSNALSAVAGGFTAMFLFWTIVRMVEPHVPCGNTQTIKHSSIQTIIPALVGTFCYVFCDTAWFSAVESEVYSLSMLFSSAIIWAMIRWAQSGEPLKHSNTQSFNHSPRWLFLVAFLLGLSVCVHQLSLLTIPALLIIYFSHRPKKKFSIFNFQFSIFFFLLGLTPYLIIPIRAASNPTINMGNPSTIEAFHEYFTREQYEHAPLLYGRCYNSPIVAFDDKGKAVYAPEMDMFFPRMWKRGPYADIYYNDWSGRHGKMVNVGGEQYYKPSQLDNMIIFGGYQLGYMYLRYLMWNFSGRYNDRQGFGNLQKGQFITGIPFIDRLYIGTSARMPDSMPRAGHNRYFLLPLILGIIGLFASFKHSTSQAFKHSGITLLTLFLMSSLALAVYLNHPMYEPRERDYAYILSFYTFAIWIAMGARCIPMGARCILHRCIKIRHIRSIRVRKKHFSIFNFQFLILFVPLLMAYQNWDDHDRSGRYIARETARNMLESCDENALLFTVGDNDTFPLWYMQEVEKCRTDVQVINISLLGSDSYAESIAHQLERTEWCAVGSADNGKRKTENEFSTFNFQLSTNSGPYRRMMDIINHYDGTRTAHFSHYAKNDSRVAFNRPLQLAGFVYRLPPNSNIQTLNHSSIQDTVDLDRCYRLMTGKPLKHSNIQTFKHSNPYIDETSHSFLRQYWLDAILAAENLADAGRADHAKEVLDTMRFHIPLHLMCDPQLTYKASQAYSRCGDTTTATLLAADCRRAVDEQLAYYSTMSPRMQHYIPYTLEPLIACRNLLYASPQQ